MKTTHYFPAILMCMGLGMSGLKAQNEPDSTGLPGDNFSLAGALEMFKKAASPEEFEKLINEEGNGVNNLDLNGDGETDYVKIINKKQDDVQIFILQVPVSATENQDVAVIELEKTGTENAILQITGDEELYGEETIVEPTNEAASETTSFISPQHGPADGSLEYNTLSAEARVIVNVWLWPCVRYVYGPRYVLWVSPWGWGHRPAWYRPWRQLTWHAFRPYRYRYPNRYVVVHTHRIVKARPIYRPVRATSVTVRTRNQVVINNYRTTRKVQSATIHTRNGKRVQATRRTTTVQGPNGGQATRTTTKVRRKRS